MLLRQPTSKMYGSGQVNFSKDEAWMFWFMLKRKEKVAVGVEEA